MPSLASLDLVVKTRTDEFNPFVRVTITPQWIRPAGSTAQRHSRDQIERRLAVLADKAARALRDDLNKWISGL